MKALCQVVILIALFSTACHRGNESNNSDWKFREGVDFVVGDLVPCSDIDGGQYLVSPLDENWTDEEQMFYHRGLNLWGEVTGFLWSAPMVVMYMDSGPSVYLQRVAEVLDGKHDERPEVKAFGWRNKFTETAAYNTLSHPPCDAVESPPNAYEFPDAYGKWQNTMRKCLDITFDLGDPCCFVVERPIIRENSGIVTLKLLEREKSHVFAHLFARLALYFDWEEGHWRYDFRKIY